MQTYAQHLHRVRPPVSLLEMQHKQSETLYPSATE